MFDYTTMILFTSLSKCFYCNEGNIWFHNHQHCHSMRTVVNYYELVWPWLDTGFALSYFDRLRRSTDRFPDSKVHGANMGPTWVLSAPDGPHVGPMNLAIRGCMNYRPRNMLMVSAVGSQVRFQMHWQISHTRSYVQGNWSEMAYSVMITYLLRQNLDVMIMLSFR